MSKSNLYQLLAIYPKTARVVLTGIFNDLNKAQTSAISFSTKNLALVRDSSERINTFQLINWDLANMSRSIYHDQLNRAIIDTNNKSKYEIPFYSIVSVENFFVLNKAYNGFSIKFKDDF